MKIAVHDYGGYGFPPQLSRELAARGHDVLHLYFAEVSADKGNLARSEGDPATFAIEAVHLGEDMQRYSIRKRFIQEHRYGSNVAKRLASFQPDVTISANTPLFAQRPIAAFAKSHASKFVIWHQDIVSYAMRDVMADKLPVIGKQVGELFVRLEKSLTDQADHVVVIASDFVDELATWGVPRVKCTVIENWAPIDELPIRARHNSWSAEQSLDDKFVFLYSGALGLKHNPSLLVDLARATQEQNGVVVVNSEGLGADWIRKELSERPAANLKLLGFQPYEQFPEVLASADVLVAILEPSAGRFSVPSKVLTYLCAKKPILASIPSENLAARNLNANNAGIAVDPSDREAFLDAAKQLIGSPDVAAKYADNARHYAETAFDINTITNRFESVLTHIML